jgi:hypothetical protein
MRENPRVTAEKGKLPVVRMHRHVRIKRMMFLLRRHQLILLKMGRVSSELRTNGKMPRKVTKLPPGRTVVASIDKGGDSSILQS